MRDMSSRTQPTIEISTREERDITKKQRQTSWCGHTDLDQIVDVSINILQYQEEGQVEDFLNSLSLPVDLRGLYKEVIQFRVL